MAMMNAISKAARSIINFVIQAICLTYSRSYIQITVIPAILLWASLFSLYIEITLFRGEWISEWMK